MSENEYKWREYPRFVELCNKPGGVDEIEDAEWGQLTLHFAPLLAELVERLQSQVSTAVDIINHGVDLMTSEQVGQWTGVRTFLEQDDVEDYLTLKELSERIAELEEDKSVLTSLLEDWKALAVKRRWEVNELYKAIKSKDKIISSIIDVLK